MSDDRETVSNPEQPEAGRRHTGGKPAVEFDPKLVRTIASIGGTYQDVANAYNCSVRTVERRIREPEDNEEPNPIYTAWSEGQAKLKMSLRRQQIKIAFGTSKAAVQMLIHMSKHQLGETDAAALGLAKGKGGGLTFVIEG